MANKKLVGCKLLKDEMPPEKLLFIQHMAIEQLYRSGLATKQIARSVGLPINDVNMYLANLLRIEQQKLGSMAAGFVNRTKNGKPGVVIATQASSEKSDAFRNQLERKDNYPNSTIYRREENN